MSEMTGGQKRIGLALSGGGFRAAAFHLGVFKKLKALGLLENISLLSCVSGGSIAGAFLALNWNDPDKALVDLENYLNEKSISVSTFLGGLFDPFSSRLDKLADSYDEDLFHKKTLLDLRGGPRIYLNSTNLATGNMFSFIAGGPNGPEHMRDWEMGKVSAGDFPISRAVAASSAFPPVYPPLRLDQDKYPKSVPGEDENQTAEVIGWDFGEEDYLHDNWHTDTGGQESYVTLTDGGVYDNMGVNPLVSQRKNLDYLIVSDGGKPFKLDARAAESGLGALYASIGIMMEQIRSLQFSRLAAVTTKKIEGNPKSLWFSIDSQKGEENRGDAKSASNIPTDLASLTTDQLQLLSRHAGALLQARMNRWAPELG
ncbi:MAG: hypothetical protein AMJ67_15360 [Betaproteobacteria bacterium SG8_41]|nr:MAG: hypothetical protein AMJ67_15360 [Betaproteobacteria bacterium SG8_41]